MAGQAKPPRPVRQNLDDASFTRQLRYEFADAEGRAILYSYVLSGVLGLVWILLVLFLPAPPNSINLLKEEEPVAITVKAEDVPTPTPAPVPAASAGGAPKVAAPAKNPGGGKGGPPKNDTRAINDAFGGSPSNNTGGMVGDVSNALRGTEVATGTGSAPGAQGKAVIGYGAGGQSSRTPGRGGLGEGLGGNGAGGGLGGVGGGGGVGFATVRVAPPSVIHAENVGGPGRNVSDLGDYVRGRNSQLQFCYSEYGLKVNPQLAGSVTVAVTLTSEGSVTGVDITKHTWSGPGSAEAESCIKQRISGWKFPSSEHGGGTYSFSFSFSR
ncbi:MAG TPA: AgmX/PglI C-terminal domain-containing protein [Gemmatimonadaceae bacterium]|nr:AgmX/PglI C-terminal domain-containing protein [Gemmatimonadaceae bacterium]